MSNFYFTSSGQLKFTSGASAMSGIQDLMNPTQSNQSSSYSMTDWKMAALEASGLNQSADGSTSAFSDSMKAAAQGASGKLSVDQKKALMSNSLSFQTQQYYRAKINEIRSREPRTFGEDSDYTPNLSLFKSFTPMSYEQYKKL